MDNIQEQFDLLFEKLDLILERLPPKKRRDKPFEIPTEQEVREYCTARQNTVNPKAFISHYEVSGWKRGNTPIKDWKACVRTWEQFKAKKNQHSVVPSKLKNVNNIL